MLSIDLSTFRYPDISLEDIQRICPACRGTCNCKVCLRGDNLIKVLNIWIKRVFYSFHYSFSKNQKIGRHVQFSIDVYIVISGCCDMSLL